MMQNRASEIPSNNRQVDESVLGFRVSLFSTNGKMLTLWLPPKPDGYYHFSDSAEFSFLTVESENDQWVMCCKRPGFFKNVQYEFYSKIPLKDNQYIEVECEEKEYALYVHSITRDRIKFKNYTLHSEIEVSIGSSHTNDIVYSADPVAPNHAVISRKDGKWYIQKGDQFAKVYVNGTIVDSARLHLGDAVYIMGLQILIGTNFISVNDPNDHIVIKERILRSQTRLHSGYGRYSGQEPQSSEERGDDFFNRAPRKRLFHKEKTITVEPPPLSMERAQIPLILRMGSSMVMSGKAAMTGNYTMLLSSLLFPLLSSNYTEGQRKDYEERRRAKYTEYLEQKRQEINRACAEEEELLRRKFPVISALVRESEYRKHIWERHPQDSDFLELRIGRGSKEPSTILNYPERKFEIESDHLEEKMYQLVEQKYLLENIPITFSATAERVCGISGGRSQTIALIHQLITQIAFFHSYDEVKMMFLLSQDDLQQFDYVRYLPHTWNDQRTMRFIATNEAEAFSIGEYIQNQLPDDLEKAPALEHILSKRAYHIIVALDKKLLNSIEPIKALMQVNANHGFSVFAAFDELPKECSKIISLEETGANTLISLQENSDGDVAFNADHYDSDRMTTLMKELANLSIKSVSQEQQLPKMLSFLEMFQVGKPEHLNPQKRWRENNPIKSLAAPVGVAQDGSLFMLDLHEKRQGPHGLVAGMTGSGKSEFLITYILSMAVNYHPDEVAFVLIDYKGGGLADAFANPRTGVKLPHLAGTITNLDGASIQRSLMSIESELVRRQKEFSKASKEFDEGSMNIYTYQKLYRAGKVLEPMPHLFIISDEFAELKQQQPEFMDKLISAARIGRSLGVHLILATQKPAGVVNDQIRSNTKFRVCLRVQDRTDSMDMLKRPEAAELTDTGRFYLQVGYNEFFAMGQSAWCGADYEPQDTVPVRRDNAVEFLDMTGQVVTKNKPKIKKTRSGMTQISAVVQYLNDLAKSQNIHSRSLGVEPLPAKIEYADLAAKYGEITEGMSALIGLVDDPMRQTQLPLHLDMMSFHHMALVGLAGSGKSSFFKTMLYSLVMNHTPEEVNFYILDLSGGVLSAFKNMPHCGAYLTKENEPDFERLLALVQDIVEERKKQFADADVYSYDDYLNVRKLPLALVILDGWTNIHSFANGQQYSLGISKYMREAANYGVHFLFSANHLNEFSSKVNQELDYKIVLQAKDKFEYNDILGLRNAIVPPEVPGRGLCNMDGQALEYHVAAPYCKLGAQEQATRIREDLQDRASQLEGRKAAKCLPVVDEKLEYTNFCESFAPDRIPLGFSLQTMQPIAMPLQQLHTMGMYFGNPIGTRSVIFNILSAFRREKAEVIILRRTSDTIFDRSGEKKLQSLYGDRYSIWDTTEESVPKLFELLVSEYIPKYRVPYRNEYCELHGIPATDKSRTVKASRYIRSKTTPLLVLFESFADLAATDKDAVFAEVFGALRGFNVYYVGCFYPEDESISTNRVFRSFSKDDFSLLFGGQFHKQWVTSIPPQFRSMEKVNPNYNRFLMKYRSECHRVVMPCGELISTNTDPDEKEII